MLSKKLSHMFLLVLLLSMGMVSGQSTTPTVAGGRIALLLDERSEGFELSTMQVGASCVPSFVGQYELRAKVEDYIFPLSLAKTPEMELGDFVNSKHLWYTFPQIRQVRAGYAGLFTANGFRQGIYLLSPTQLNQTFTKSCSVGMDFRWEYPVVVTEKYMGNDQELLKKGTPVKSASYDGVRHRLSVEMISHHPTEVLVFQKVRNPMGDPSTLQRIFNLDGNGLSTIDISFSSFDQKIPLYAHIYDTYTGVSWTAELMGENTFVSEEGGVLNPKFRAYCRAFTGFDGCAPE